MTLLLWNGNGWGTREQAIPGEWAMLVLISVLGAALGFLVIWFTLLRHEKAMRSRDRRANRQLGSGVAIIEIGSAVEEAAVPEDGMDSGPDAEPEPEPEHALVPETELADVSAETDESDESDELEPANGASPEPAPRRAPAANGRRKLTDDILNRVEEEIAGGGKRRWKDLAALVHHEFGVSVHPSSIQKALKRRDAESTADPASA